jgi:hypothetical protein
MTDLNVNAESRQEQGSEAFLAQKRQAILCDILMVLARAVMAEESRNKSKDPIDLA